MTTTVEVLSTGRRLGPNAPLSLICFQLDMKEVCLYSPQRQHKNHMGCSSWLGTFLETTPLHSHCLSGSTINSSHGTCFLFGPFLLWMETRIQFILNHGPACLGFGNCGLFLYSFLSICSGVYFMEWAATGMFLTAWPSPCTLVPCDKAQPSAYSPAMVSHGSSSWLDTAQVYDHRSAPMKRFCDRSCHTGYGRDWCLTKSLIMSKAL